VALATRGSPPVIAADQPPSFPPAAFLSTCLGALGNRLARTGRGVAARLPGTIYAASPEIPGATAFRGNPGRPSWRQALLADAPVGDGPSDAVLRIGRFALGPSGSLRGSSRGFVPFCSPFTVCSRRRHVLRALLRSQAVPVPRGALATPAAGPSSQPASRALFVGPFGHICRPPPVGATIRGWPSKPLSAVRNSHNRRPTTAVREPSYYNGRQSTRRSNQLARIYLRPQPPAPSRRQDSRETKSAGWSVSVGGPQMAISRWESNVVLRIRLVRGSGRS